MLAVSVAFTSSHVVYDYLLPAKYDKFPISKLKAVCKAAIVTTPFGRKVVDTR